MTYYIVDQNSVLAYVPHFREYTIPTKKCGIVTKIDYCPWCATKLPKDLRDEFFDIFYDELKLDLVSGLDTLDTPGLPEDFKTDKWWKKRGL